jgi:hypothetical protein
MIYNFILGLSIVFAVIIGIIRFKVIDKSYHPFIYLNAISLLVEVLTYALPQVGQNSVTVIIANIFSFTEFYFFTWLFHNWGLFNFKKRIFILVCSIYFLAWVGFIFCFGGIKHYDLYFPVIASVTIIFFAVTVFNKFIVQDRTPFIKNPKFWIVTGIIIFFAFYVLITSTHLSLFGKQTSEKLAVELHKIVVYPNLLVNLMYAIAVLCIPKKKKNFTKLF